MIKEERIITWFKLQSLCVEREWYTRGNNEAFVNLLSMTCNKNITTKNIVEMATDIIAHSDTDMSLENVCFEIGRVTTSLFEEVDA